MRVSGMLRVFLVWVEISQPVIDGVGEKWTFINPSI